jgi:hypothetical protein
MYLCKNTTHLTHLATLFSQIVEQENSFLLELNTFQLMLQQAEIISTTVKPKDNNTKTIRGFTVKKSSFREISKFRLSESTLKNEAVSWRYFHSVFSDEYRRHRQFELQENEL